VPRKNQRHRDGLSPSGAVRVPFLESSAAHESGSAAHGEVYAALVDRRRPLDQLHDDRTRAAGFFEAVDMNNVGVVEGGENFCFALESGQPLRVTR
jgi:hypothetical protein